jgi:uncharacterized protein (TIGR02246 family)
VLLEILFLAAAAPPAPAQASQVSSSVVHAEPHGQIREFFAQYFEAVERGHPDGILALVDDDFVVKWPVGHPINDRERLRAALSSMQQSVRQKVEWQLLEADVAGDWAWARVAEKATHFPHKGGPSRVLEGSHLTILRKARGRWLLHRDYGSLNELPAQR